MGRTAEIRIDVTLDANNVPEAIRWRASDGPGSGTDAEALMFSIWDAEQRNTLSIDLWTPRMTVDEMNFFVLQALMKMAETYRKATGEAATSDLIDSFVRQLTEHLEQKARSQSEA